MRETGVDRRAVCCAALGMKAHLLPKITVSKGAHSGSQCGATVLKSPSMTMQIDLLQDYPHGHFTGNIPKANTPMHTESAHIHQLSIGFLWVEMAFYI